MDFNQLVEVMKTNLTWPEVVLFVLLIVSEILGTNESIKASSIYGVIKALLMTVKDQVFPTKPAA